MSLDLLPKELLKAIVEYVPLESQLAFFCVCTKFNSFVDDKRALIRKEFDELYSSTIVTKKDEVDCRIQFTMKPNKTQLTYVKYWRELKALFDMKTQWVDDRIRSLEPLPDTSTMLKLLHLIKRNHPHLPPPTDHNNVPNHMNYMELNSIPTPTSAHKTALHRILNDEIPTYQLLRWADYWNENADGFFKFEIIVVHPNLITGHYARGYNTNAYYQQLFEVTNLSELEPFLSLCEIDFEYYMGYQSYLPHSMISWGNLRNSISDRLSFEIRESGNYLNQYNSAIHSSTQECMDYSSMDIFSLKSATKYLDSIEFPHHNASDPPNPFYPAKQEDETEWNAIHWRKVKISSRKSSKTIQSAIERCIRRSIYFLLQKQLEKYWQPSEKEWKYARTNIDLYTDEWWKFIKHLGAHWVPFSQTSSHNTEQKLWPIFLLDVAICLVKPVSILIANSVKKVSEEMYRNAVKELGFHRFVVDDEQVAKLVSLLNKQ